MGALGGLHDVLVALKILGGPIDRPGHQQKEITTGVGSVTTDLLQIGHVVELVLGQATFPIINGPDAELIHREFGVVERIQFAGLEKFTQGILRQTHHKARRRDILLAKLDGFVT